MALTAPQLALIAEVTRETYSTVAALVTSLTVDQEGLLSDDLDLWEAIRDSHIRYSGEGVDFDNARKRAAIFYRVRHMLGLPFISYDLELAAGYSVNVGHTVRW